ncbi:nucleotidyl transferase AbiEii/AbiGii toxin family protein [Isoptericola croceus]|uniref:nucleotidyl transferase AbiEii/AbiGii toxin family protein n=1 Tax=Isoptericola croceus TaxID=3031406 RepID=UPI0023F98F8A|nr:nucleotidyl transferase AbiEii/AbiGii toxin family protein [Isoptericola croceus]
MDVDALARNLRADQESVISRVAEIAAIEIPGDGVEYLVDSVRASTIRDDGLYAGVRVVMEARIATAQVKIQLDVNFGDPVTPAPRLVELPSLRDGEEHIRVRGYPIETVLAEKLATAIALGAASTRVRDWADVYDLTGTQSVTYAGAREALEATAGFRGTALRPLSVAIGTLASIRSGTYSTYRRRLGPDGERLPESFAEVVDAVIAFADPLVDGTASYRWNHEGRHWDA